MKISKLETFGNEFVCFVRVATDTGNMGCDVAGGEQDWDLGVWERMIESHVVDIVQPDVMCMGGISRTLEVVQMAAQAGMPCTPHSRALPQLVRDTPSLIWAQSIRRTPWSLNTKP
jgi:L-alanine-DL-glutamate epimerase-like enolase superfamily enzyme